MTRAGRRLVRPPRMRGRKQLAALARAVDGQDLGDICAAAADYTDADPYARVTVKATRKGGLGSLYCHIQVPGQDKRTFSPFDRPPIFGVERAVVSGELHTAEKWAQREKTARDLIRASMTPVRKKDLWPL